MNSLFFRNIIIVSSLFSLSIDAKKSKEPKEKVPMTQEQKAAIVSGVAQILNSVINIIAHKIANRTIDINDKHAIQRCIQEICQKYERSL